MRRNSQFEIDLGARRLTNFAVLRFGTAPDVHFQVRLRRRLRQPLGQLVAKSSGGFECFWTPEQLLRKEVIQPHLPIRLPCYDFTPITRPTFDGSLPCGLGHRLRVFRAFVV